MRQQALSAIFLGVVSAFPVYLSLLPVCAGVAIASAGKPLVSCEALVSLLLHDSMCVACEL